MGNGQREKQIEPKSRKPKNFWPLSPLGRHSKYLLHSNKIVSFQTKSVQLYCKKQYRTIFNAYKNRILVEIKRHSTVFLFPGALFPKKYTRRFSFFPRLSPLVGRGGSHLGNWGGRNFFASFPSPPLFLFFRKSNLPPPRFQWGNFGGVADGRFWASIMDFGDNPLCSRIDHIAQYYFHLGSFWDIYQFYYVAFARKSPNDEKKYPCINTFSFCPLKKCRQRANFHSNSQHRKNRIPYILFVLTTKLCHFPDIPSFPLTPKGNVPRRRRQKQEQTLFKDCQRLATLTNQYCHGHGQTKQHSPTTTI